MHSPRPSGFTLIEILMVVALLGIVSAYSASRFIDFRSDAKAALTKDRLSSLRNAITGDARLSRTGYLTHMGRLPASLTELVTKGTQPNYDPINKIGWNGPYVDSTVSDWNADGWGTAFQFDSATRTLRSCGPNLTCGDSDDLTATF